MLELLDYLRLTRIKQSRNNLDSNKREHIGHNMEAIMKCNICDTEIKASEKYCPQCGTNQLSNIDFRDASSIPKNQKQNQRSIALLTKSFRSIGFILIGIFVLFQSVYWQHSWSDSAVYGNAQDYADVMSNITSEGGNTIDEVYYQNMGKILHDYTSIIIDGALSEARIWLTLNRMCFAGGLILINIGIGGLVSKRKSNIV